MINKYLFKSKTLHFDVPYHPKIYLTNITNNIWIASCTEYQPSHKGYWCPIHIETHFPHVTLKYHNKKITTAKTKQPVTPLWTSAYMK